MDQILGRNSTAISDILERLLLGGEFTARARTDARDLLVEIDRATDAGQDPEAVEILGFQGTEIYGLLAGLSGCWGYGYDPVRESGARRFVDAERARSIKAGQAMMQAQIDNMDADELASFHRMID